MIHGLSKEEWSEEGSMCIEYEGERYDVFFEDGIVIKKYNDDDEKNQNYYCLPNNDIFMGEYKEDYTEEGKGMLICSSNIVYEGSFKERKRNGYGKITLPNYLTIKGYWDDNEKLDIISYNGSDYKWKYFSDKECNLLIKMLYQDNTILYQQLFNNEMSFFNDRKDIVYRSSSCYFISFDDENMMMVSIKDDENDLWNHPELLNKNNNLVSYYLSDGVMIKTHAFFDKESKKLIEQGTITIDGENYRIEFIEDDSVLLCGRMETILDKKIVSFIFYDNGDVYVGDTVNNSIKDGVGMIQFSEGNTFIGVFKNDINNGRGIYNGIQYKNGKWENNKYIPGEEIWKEFKCGKYKGDLVNGLPNGNGIMYYHSGGKYTGEWKNGKKNGKGMFISKLTTRKGTWVNGAMEGKGTITFNDTKERYLGDFKNGKFEGKGIYFYQDGGKYIGEFKNDKKNGKGVFYDKYGNEEYNGDYLNGHRTGKGIIYYRYSQEGVKYIGEVLNGKRNGKGEYLYTDGTIFEGYFVNDNVSGNGKILFSNSDVYTGQFSNGKINGFGVMKYKNGNCYKGEFKNGKKEGNGIVYINSQELFVGEFKNNDKEGLGFKKFENGDEFIGYFESGESEGFGIMKYSNGDRYEGFFSKYQRLGRGRFIDKKGKSKFGIWEGNEYREDDKSLYPKQCLSSFESYKSLYKKIDSIRQKCNKEIK